MSEKSQKIIRARVQYLLERSPYPEDFIERRFGKGVLSEDATYTTIQLKKICSFFGVDLTEIIRANVEDEEKHMKKIRDIGEMYQRVSAYRYREIDWQKVFQRLDILLSQSELPAYLLALELGVTGKTLGDWRVGKGKSIYLSNVAKICVFLRVSPEYLLGV